MGFSVPIQDWFQNDFKKLVKEYLDGEKIKKQGLFEKITSNYFMDRNINYFKCGNTIVGISRWYGL